MKLTFLGKTYNTSTTAIETTETQETVTFLGHRSKLKQYNVTQRQQPSEELTFLGQRYTR